MAVPNTLAFVGGVRGRRLLVDVVQNDHMFFVVFCVVVGDNDFQSRNLLGLRSGLGLLVVNARDGALDLQVVDVGEVGIHIEAVVSGRGNCRCVGLCRAALGCADTKVGDDTVATAERD